MPVIKSAIKKLRKDRKREKINDSIRHDLKRVINTAKKDKTAKSLTAAFSALDKAAKNNIIHKNKAARLKSNLSKLLPRKEGATAPKKPAAAKPAVKKAPKKTTTKKAAK